MEDKMKRYSFIALLFALVLAFNGVCFAWGTAGGDGSNYGQLQETAVFFNNAGETVSAGAVVILDTAGTGVAADTTLGSYVTMTNSADSILAVGVAKVSSSNQTPVIVVTKGPIDTLADDSADAVSINTAVGTTGGKGRVGGGTNLGVALEAGDGTATGKLFVWVDPTGAD
jgi:hypothetical protein